MSLLWIDGFEGNDYSVHYTPGGTQFATQATTRFGQGVSLYAISAAPGYQARNITPSAEVYTGCAFLLTGTGAITRDLLIFLADAGAVSHVTVAVNANGGIDIKRGTTVVASSATGVVAKDTWFYLEAYAKVNDTTGAVAVRLNGAGTDLVTFSGDTKNAGTSTNIDQVRFGLGATNVNQVTNIDDIYICDGLGTANNGFLGDRRVQTLFPSGPGATTGLTPTGSATNWQNVDEPTASAADYNGSATPGARDTYALPDLVTAGAVNGVRVCMNAHKSDAGAASMKAAIKVGGTTAYDATVVLPSTMGVSSAIREVSPATSAAWTLAEVNGMEIGAEVV